jgi:hypothetical protein
MFALETASAKSLMFAFATKDSKVLLATSCPMMNLALLVLSPTLLFSCRIQALSNKT